MAKVPSLDDVSKNKTTEESNFERRRLPRLSLTTEQFKLDQNGRIFPIADLSSKGMAIRVIETSDFRYFPVGSKFKGTLNLRREKFRVSAQVRHLGNEMVGCEFFELEEKSATAIAEFLDPIALAKELRPIPATDGVALWYHGPSGTDFLLWRASDGKYTRMTLFLLGTFVQWEEDKGLTTGRLAPSTEQSEVRGVIRLETMLLENDRTPDVNKVSLARTLIHESSITADLKSWCVRHFEVKG